MNQNTTAAIGAIILFGVFIYAGVKGLVTQVVPMIGVVRSGRQADGKVIERKSSTNPYRKATIPVVEFTCFRGKRIKFSDIYANKRPEQPGEHVVVHYDPEDPSGSATMVTLRGAYRALGQFFLFELVCAGVVVLCFLDVFRVIYLSWL